MALGKRNVRFACLKDKLEFKFLTSPECKDMLYKIHSIVTQIVLKVTVVMKLFQHIFSHKNYCTLVPMK